MSILSASALLYKVLIVADAKGSIREIILPKGLDLDRPKRTRTSFTAEQLYRLEMEFQRCQYVVGRERTELARQLNLSETQVCVHWTCIC